MKKHLCINDASVIKITNEINSELVPLFLRVLNAHNNNQWSDELCDEMMKENIDIDTYTDRVSEELCVIVDVGSSTFRVDGDAVTMEKTI